MSFWDDILGIGGDIISGAGKFFGSNAGNQVLSTGMDLLSPQIQQWLYGNANPNDFLSPEQQQAITLSNQVRQFQLASGDSMLQYATPEAQEAIVRREAARGAYEADLVRTRKVQ